MTDMHSNSCTLVHTTVWHDRHA